MSSANPNPERPAYPPFYSKTALIQLGYGIWVNLAMVSTGLGIGFSAIAVPKLETDNQINLTTSEASWITSVLPLTMPVGSMIAGFITDRCGRRFSLIVGQIPTAFGWFYIAFATAKASPSHIIVGRMINAIGAGMGTGSPRAYVTEITLPNMRAVVGALSNLSVSAGIAVLAQLASLFNLGIICIICGCFSIALGVCNCFLPETPYYVLMKDDIEKTRATLMKFRSKNYDVDKEMPDLIEFKQSTELRRLSLKQKINELFKARAWKPYCLMNLFFMFGQLSGISITTFWTVKLLQESMSSVNPYTGNILMAIARLFSGLMVTILLYKVGKRPLALTSSIGACVCYVILGSYLKYATKPTVYPQLLYQSYLIFASMGYLTLPYIMAYELIPLQIRGLLGGMSVATGSVMIFTAVKMYPYLREKMSLSNIILTFSVNAFIGAIYLYLFLPETKNKTLHDLEKVCGSNKSLFVHRKRRSTTVELAH